ncbi:glutamate--tRNA ligase family protein [Mucilaginibacter aquaedulcis]|uniref:glutamate--tRNA ligase family protein n=1 Tax=Mucilaginibacter aquaedulcis TaxID=1187081 RepID=UPI0025B37CED|nr:glutamate--tRNA ligase family protein [Mucilaginibacter aquaedulcis]MDN3547351.1 glutamate--tRNA ligase family protein [Mucilaginibacter aquaedulcis]
MPEQFKNFNKTRIAPTPSGFLHLGNVLSFAITAALAQKSGAKILLRIDDMDRARAEEQYIQDIFDTLHFLEIPWHEGPRNAEEFNDSYSQMHRLHLYQEAIDQLREADLVFACTCSRKQLIENACTCFEKSIPLSAPDASWRLRTNNSHELIIKNHNGLTARAVLPVDMHNFIIRKKDSFPAYQLTSVVDDMHYDVDMIVRGNDLWASTLAQQELAHALGRDSFRDIAFYHHTLLTDDIDQKLSKSAGATSVRYLRENGKTPADVYMLIARMLNIQKPIGSFIQLADEWFQQQNPA